MKAMKEERKPEDKWSDGTAPTQNTNCENQNATMLELDSSVGEDCTDALPANLSFTVIDIIVLVISIASYLFDTGSDVAVALKLYQTGYMAYFGLTVTFIVLPAIVMAGFSLKWYISDKKQAEDQGKQKVITPTWILRIIGVCFHMGPVMRYLTSLYYGLKFRKSKKSKLLYHLMINEDADAALLRLFECFMESGPQLILQIYILAVETAYQDGHWLIVSIQVLSILSSLFSMAWSLVSYHRTLRISLESKANISGLGSFTQLLWHLFMISARVIALALFASLHPVWFVVFCVSHWGVMTLWIISMRTEFCETRCGEIIYNAVLGVIYIFCYFNAVDSPTRFRYIAYYSISFVENSIFIFVWYYMCNPSLWYRHAALAAQISCFFIGLVFMVVYYLLLHPVGSFSVKICSNRDHCRSGHEFSDDGTANHIEENKRLGRLDVVDNTPGKPVLVQYGIINSPLTNHSGDAEPNGNDTLKKAVETAV